MRPAQSPARRSRSRYRGAVSRPACFSTNYRLLRLPAVRSREKAPAQINEIDVVRSQAPTDSAIKTASLTATWHSQARPHSVNNNALFTVSRNVAQTPAAMIIIRFKHTLCHSL